MQSGTEDTRRELKRLKIAPTLLCAYKEGSGLSGYPGSLCGKTTVVCDYCYIIDWYNVSVHAGK